MDRSPSGLDRRRDQSLFHRHGGPERQRPLGSGHRQLRQPHGQRAAGSGDGTFSRTITPSGSNPIAVAIADIDGDGCLDLVVANYVSNSVSVLRATATARLGARGALQRRLASLRRVGCGPGRRWPAGSGDGQSQFQQYQRVAQHAVKRWASWRLGAPITPPAAARCLSRPRTWTATGCWIWRWPTTAATRSACCRATAMEVLAPRRIWRR
jgi:hypothetical protein